MLPGMMPTFSLPSGGSSIVLTDQVGQTASPKASWTFAARNIGPAAVGRRVVVCVAFNQATVPGFTSVTLGGVAMTQAIMQSDGANSRVAIYVLQVDAGTTADIVVTLTAVSGRMSAMVYALYGIASSTPTHTQGSAVASPTVNLNISANGVAVAVASMGSTTASSAWTGLTENTDTVYDAPNNISYTSASDRFAAAQTGRAIQVTPTPTNSARSMAAASFA